MRFLPNFKGFDFFPHDLRVPFMRYKGLAFWMSIAAMVLSLALFLTRGLNYGVDFKGGSMIEVQSTTGPADVASMRDKLGRLGLGGVQIQSFGSPTDVLIRVEVVGPAVSSELRLTGFIAVTAGLMAIVAYVWFRFEWQFAVGAIVALTHDVLVTVGVFSILQLEFDLSIVAALLTILGYSVNDTVVVSDRVRENLRKFKRMELDELLNLSINETLSRTILTGITAVVVLISLYIFGGEVMRSFNFAMLMGVLVGTYSSIFIAAPLLGYLGVKREWSATRAASPRAEAKRA
jgi:preprotein translocase subunit SecF/SecD/SecF fusion protein